MIGQVVSHYRILSQLGGGGMGVVYEAEDLKLGRRVALKFLPVDMAADRQALERFQREARATSALNHPNICTIHDVDEHEGRPFIAMELLVGQTLHQKLLAGPLALDDVLDVSFQLSDALDAAHATGIVHRDIKPANIFITQRGHAKVLDFGLAKLIRDRTPLSDHTAMPTAGLEGQMTNPGMAVGTIAYMSPEQARGEELDARSDLFSLGVVLYQMATGKAAFSGNTSAVLFDAILNREPVSALRLNPALPAQLQEVIGHLLEKDRDVRYQTASDLRAALKRLKRDTSRAPAASLTTTGATASVAPPVSSAPGSGAAHAARPGPARNALIAAGAVLILLAAGAWLWLSRSGSETTTGTRIASLAVLPFVNATGDADREYLTDGITEGIINNMAKVPDLRVMARSTVFRYKDKQDDPQRVGTDLGAQAVLSGRLTQRGTEMAIQVDLIDVAGGTQIWGERYIGGDAILASLQDRIAGDLTARLRPEAASRLAAPGGSGTANADAYQLYLKGRFHWNKRTTEDVRKSMQHFKDAIAADPNYALAYVGLSDAYGVSPSYDVMSSKESIPLAEAAASKALAIDPQLGEAHAALASTMVWHHDWSGAERGYRRAIEMNPRNATTHYFFGLLCLLPQKRYEESIVEFRKALELEPFSQIINANLGSVLLLAGRVSEAEMHLLSTLEAFPDFQIAHLRLNEVYEQQGRYEEAWTEYVRFDPTAASDAMPPGSGKKGYWEARLRSAERDMERGVTRNAVPAIYLGVGDHEKAIKACEKLVAERVETFPWFIRLPRMDPLRSDPRYIAMMRKMNLEP